MSKIDLDPDTAEFLTRYSTRTAGAYAAEKEDASQAEFEWSTQSIPGRAGSIAVKVFRPESAAGTAPVMVYLHGGGWARRGFLKYEKFLVDVAESSGCVLVFVEYSLTPTAVYPVAINEAFDVVKHVSRSGSIDGIDGDNLILIGDCTGGNMVAAVCLMAKSKNIQPVSRQILLCPSLDGFFKAESYREFEDDYYITADMVRELWDGYANGHDRKDILLSPASAESTALAGLPPALVVTCELDVLRDDGREFAKNLAEAGVDVVWKECPSMIHDFFAIDALSHRPERLNVLEQIACFAAVKDELSNI